MAAEAGARGIPWFRLVPPMRDLQLGQGSKRRRMRETMRDDESLIAASYAGNKALTYGLLSAVGIPVGRFGVAASPDEAVSAASAIGYPVVLKTTEGKRGEGVVAGLGDPEAVRDAAQRLLSSTPQLVVQSLLRGDDHRLLVVSGRLVAAARLEPAAVVGDGIRDIG